LRVVVLRVVFFLLDRLRAIFDSASTASDTVASRGNASFAAMKARIVVTRAKSFCEFGAWQLFRSLALADFGTFFVCLGHEGRMMFPKEAVPPRVPDESRW
jgi:hypothetical protein